MLIKNILSNSFFNFTKLGVGFLVNVIIARVLFDSSRYGLLALSLSYIDVLIVVFGLGANGALVRFSKEQFDKNKLYDYVKENYSNVFTIHVFITILILLFRNYFSQLFFGSSNEYILLYLIIICFFTKTIQLWISSIFWGLNRFTFRGIVIITLPIIKILLLSFLYVLKSKGSLVNIVYIFIISELISSFLLLILYKREFGNMPFKFFQKPSLLSPNVKISFSFGLWSMFAGISMLLMNLVDKIFISKYIDLATLGKYTILVMLVSYFTLSIMMISNVLLSNYLKLWEKNKSLVIYKINKIFYIVLSAITLGGICFSYFIDYFIKNVYGEIYLGLNYIVPFLLIAMIFNATYMLFGNLAAISKKPKLTAYSFAFGLVINLIGNFIFVPEYGIYAVVITTVISYLFISMAMCIFLYKNIEKFSLKPLFFTYVSSLIIFYVC